MDLVLDVCDDILLDKAYKGLQDHLLYSLSPILPKDSLVKQAIFSLSDRDFILRQELSLFLISVSAAIVLYFTIASLSYFLIYDKEQMKHPKFLKNQIWMEIKVAVGSFPLSGLLTSLGFLLEVRGYSKLYMDIESNGGYLYLLASIPIFLFFTDCLIYWIHRGLHSRLLYAPLHKLHHKWIIPTPFASHAFHPLDGYFQSLPYHLFVFIFPCHKILYLILFVFVNIWTVGIHDGVYFTQNGFINGSANHTIHHVYFNYNYGQYFTIWDKIGGTFRMPTAEQYNRTIRLSKETLEKESKFVDNFNNDSNLKEE